MIEADKERSFEAALYTGSIRLCLFLHQNRIIQTAATVEGQRFHPRHFIACTNEIIEQPRQDAGAAALLEVPVAVWSGLSPPADATLQSADAATAASRSFKMQQ